MQIHLVGAELFHADGRTDMTQLIVVFRNFAKAPNKCSNNTIILSGYYNITLYSSMFRERPPPSPRKVHFISLNTAL
jgi:hypothetical protein